MSDFFGFDGYKRQPEGFLSWQHIVFVTTLILIMLTLAIFFGLKNKNKDLKTKNKVLICSAILINVIELSKIILICFRNENPFSWLYELPLFLCSIQLITIPLAAFTKGRIKEASLDFVLIFGMIAAVLGTYGAGNNYSSYPVLSFDNVNSGITHCISGFSAIYIALSGMTSLKSKNIHLSFIILFSFCIAAFIANKILDYNYMFLVRGDGTPYDIFYNLVNGNQIIYPIIVVLLFVLYISVFYFVYYTIKKIKLNKQNKKAV